MIDEKEQAFARMIALFRYRGLDGEALAAAHQRNMEALMDAARRVMEGIEDLTRRQVTLVQDSARGMMENAPALAHPSEFTAASETQAGLISTTARQTLRNFVQLTELLLSNHIAIATALNQSVVEGLRRLDAAAPAGAPPPAARESGRPNLDSRGRINVRAAPPPAKPRRPARKRKRRSPRR